MDPTQVSVAWLLVGAVVINIVIYVGVTWVYFVDKHRVDPPKQDVPAARVPGRVPARVTRASQEEARGRRDAA